jgi:succinate-semialdehyde dehydrogenase/glutarate-semialdehyde dehydrogenase
MNTDADETSQLRPQGVKDMHTTAELRFTEPYIAGRWTSGEAGRRPVNDPATGEALTEVGIASVPQCLEAVDAAAGALRRWSAMPPRDRAEILRRAYELMIVELDPLARLIVQENGKILADAQAEVRYAAEFFRWFAEEAVRIPGDMRRSPSGLNWILVSQEPVGVALLVTPWNFPAAMATRKIAPALAAGCTVVLKPAMETPLTALALADLLERAGVPAGVVNVVTPAPAGPAVSAMLADRRVRALSFTGSTEVGRLLLAGAAGNVIRCSMELGGNAPFIVLDDADLDAAVEGLMLAKMRNGGAACTAANRILVQRGIAEEFVTRFVARMEALTLGSGLAAGTDVGPMVTAAERDRIGDLVRTAVSEGAKAVVGGHAPGESGYFYSPTVLTNVAPGSSILAEEIFGPVAPVVFFDDVEDGIELANDTDSGLVAYVYTESLERGLLVSRALESGMVGLNRGLVSDPAAPFGGVKHSGLGREGAHEGILEFLETKYVATPYLQQEQE